MRRLPFWDPYMIANPTLPSLYWEVKSPEQLIANLYCIIEDLKGYVNENADETNEHAALLQHVQQVIESIENGGYMDRYIDGLAAYIDKNLQALVARQAAYAFPTIYIEPDTGAARFAMVIPDNWDFLRFKWVWDDEDGTYRIALEY